MKNKNGLIFTIFLGTLLIWFDFFIFINIIPLLSKHFFAKPTTNIYHILLTSFYIIGMLIIPIGNWIGGRSQIKRKFSHSYSLLLIGLGSLMIGFLPTYEDIGIFASILLISVRLVQGFFMGVAINSASNFRFLFSENQQPTKKHGYLKSYFTYLQSLPLFGLFLVLLLKNWLKSSSTLGTQKETLTKLIVDVYSSDYGSWRLLFILSAFLLILTSIILKKILNKSTFVDYNQIYNNSEKPLQKKSFLTRLFLIGLGIACGVFLVQFQFLFFSFLENICFVKPENIVYIGITGLLLSLPFYYIGKLISKFFKLKIAISFLLIIFGLSLSNIYKAIQNLTETKPEMELIDLKETKIKFFLLNQTEDTLKRTIKIQKYSNGAEVKSVFFDTLTLDNKYIEGDTIYVQKKLADQVFTKMALLGSILFIIFALFCGFLATYIYSFNMDYASTNNTSLIYSVGYSVGLCIIWLTNFKHDIQIKETYTLQIKIFTIIFIVIAILGTLQMLIKNKK